MRAAVDEALAVAAASGVRVLGDAWGQVQAIARSMATQSSSTAQDLARGKPSEIDYLNGHVVRQGERLGIATPVNRTLQALVKTLEAKRDQLI
jgi:2-dehydropantoate 2-reductase